MAYNTKIPLFRRWVLQNFPFIEQDFDALTDYQLICKVVEYLNKVIETVNASTEQIELLTNTVNQLQEYIENLDLQDEVNNKIDQMVEDGTLQEIIAEYIHKVDYFLIDSNSTIQDIQTAFAGNGNAKVIEFEKGTYTLSQPIAITSNTTVYLNGSTINSSYLDEYNDNFAFLAINANFTGYNGISNVSFYNGTINTGFVFMHSNNITLDGIEFGNNITSHCIQIAGCKDFTIKNCIFNGTIINDTKGAKHECIQIETCNYDGQPYLPAESSCYDHTGCNNIIISGCTFNNGNEVTTRNYTSIGQHAYDDENQLALKNILIERCTFKTNHYSDIRMVDFKGCIIRNNTFNQVEDYNDQISIRISWKNEDILIENNEWISSKNAIGSSNQMQRNNIKIINNKINSSIGTGAYCVGCYNTQYLYIEGNKFITTGTAVYTNQSNNLIQTDVYINNNVFDLTNTTNSGIRILSGNKITVMNNYCIQSDTTNAFTRCSASVIITYANNVIKNDTTYNVNNISALNDYSNVYNVSYQVYNGSATYSAITDGSLSTDITKFNTLMLVVHESGSTNNGVETIILKPYAIREKFDARKYNVIFSNGSNASKYAQLTITNGTTFSWSSDDSLVLRKIYAYNQVLQ